jgi:hypothetical protein
MMFPFFPLTSPTAIRDNFVAFANHPFTWRTFTSAAILWFAVGGLFTNAAFPVPRSALFLSTVLVPIQLLIVGRGSSLVELLGALTGCTLFALLPQHRTVRVGTAVAVLLLIVVRGAVPLPDATATANAIHWIPFATLLEGGDDQRSVLILLEKIFFYGTGIWTWRAAGTRLSVATGIVAGTTAVIEALQIHAPGRTVDVTDPLLAMLLGWALMFGRVERGIARKRG